MRRALLFERLQNQIGMSASHIERLAMTASQRYKVYSIPKMSGGGDRIIEQPSKTIKSLQRWIVNAYIARLPLHSAAAAYAKGTSIRKNASRHAGTNFTLRIDFANFFPSFRIGHIERFLIEESNSAQLSHRDRSLIAAIVCRNGALTIGAPSSPALTNAMMFEFDRQLADWCKKNEIVYSRYADDLFLSCNTPGRLEAAHRYVHTIASTYPYACLTINAGKTKFLSRKYRRSVTGIILTSSGELSIGRDKKIEVKSQLYKYGKDQLEPEQILSLRGRLAFIRDADPDFYRRLENKYGLAISKISERKQTERRPIRSNLAK